MTKTTNYSSLQRFSLENKVVVLTGATGILGSLYSERLAEAGATVVIADLDDSKCRILAEKISEIRRGSAVGMAVDLSCEESVVSWSKRIVGMFGQIDVLINNAATKSPNFFKPLPEFPVSDWNRVMGVNVTGTFLSCRELGSFMAKQGSGSIINVSSIYGVVAPDQRIYEGSWYEELGGAINTPLVYSASKGSIIAITRYLASYWGHMGVRTNTLTPGGVASGQNKVFEEKYSARIPLGRMAQPEEMVGALLFLASDSSMYVNGQNIIVDGGLTAW